MLTSSEAKYTQSNGGSAEAPGWEAGAPMRGLQNRPPAWRGLSPGWGSPFRAARLGDSSRGYAPALRQGSRAKSKSEQAQGDGLWRSIWG